MLRYLGCGCLCVRMCICMCERMSRCSSRHGEAHMRGKSMSLKQSCHLAPEAFNPKLPYGSQDPKIMGLVGPKYH